MQFRPSCIVCCSDCDANGLFTSCQHFLCARCTAKYPTGTCPRCRKPCSSTSMGPMLPKEVRQRITQDPHRWLTVTAQLFDFQRRQEHQTLRRLKEIVTTLNNSNRQLMTQLTAARKEQQRLEGVVQSLTSQVQSYRTQSEELRQIHEEDQRALVHAQNLYRHSNTSLLLPSHEYSNSTNNNRANIPGVHPNGGGHSEQISRYRVGMHATPPLPMESQGGRTRTSPYDDARGEAMMAGGLRGDSAGRRGSGSGGGGGGGPALVASQSPMDSLARDWVSPNLRPNSAPLGWGATGKRLRVEGRSPSDSNTPTSGGSHQGLSMHSAQSSGSQFNCDNAARVEDLRFRRLDTNAYRGGGATLPGTSIACDVDQATSYSLSRDRDMVDSAHFRLATPAITLRQGVGRSDEDESSIDRLGRRLPTAGHRALGGGGDTSSIPLLRPLERTLP